MGLLLGGFADRRLLTGAAGEDRLHQPQRTPLFLEAPELLARLLKAGALVSGWSGAGPSLLAVCDGRRWPAGYVTLGEAVLEAAGLPGCSLTLSSDLKGRLVEH